MKCVLGDEVSAARPLERKRKLPKVKPFANVSEELDAEVQERIESR